ncbi:LysR family transcriptional regulator [Sulfitobacter mediterraneus]|jgi:DNA-binding transcriptional LysR family regulator|uniref:LysR family transcriptional regulator n=1 Tax=Sulfitobacter TaxID=60136 RepID=UPI0019328767|nr:MULTISPECIES: LysR family transcriptional regulator [Sulfitobacter]MBM1633989.1 LysR family transcriptional regulator [Sulfitobacter mediterraneus]MBM1641495.1 LysR family transcriptional regulator [Sulfitobacter mediterraneus]MBM1645854.1 LysR family transcriptional regulator [Sulfitobacter mediterraneus]MBM1649615.1 LysR family transcriptional regulator [Sulfitobacter mediterraneus]MBM1653923.1 LysR family transcriptional regulator [Sulfitobacter mediterraneus]
MNIQSLRHFVTVAEEGSLGRAREKLNITQTGLTKSIQRLETSLGGALFRRSVQGMTLTQAGRTLLPHARLVLAQSDRAVSTVSDLIEGRDGAIAIGAAPEWLEFGVEQAVLDLRQKYPGTQIFISSGRNTRALVADLRDGRLDLVVGVSQMEDMDDLIFEPIASNRQGIILAKGHELLENDPVSLKDLEAYQWVLPVRSTLFRARLDNLFLEQGLAPPVAEIETNFMPFVISCVGHSGMLGTATDALIAAHPRSDVTFLEMGSMLERPMGIMTRAGEPVTRPQRRFVDVLKAHVGKV